MWCQFIKFSEMLKKIYYAVVLFGCGTKMPDSLKFLHVSQNGYELDLGEKLQYLIKLLLTFTPVAYILSKFNMWFPDNQVFFQTMVWTIIANIGFGAWYHWKNKTFKLKVLLWKNLEMCLIILLTYPILEGINSLTGENVAGDVFKWAVQIGTILYPGSKVLKNAHLLSNKRYPPEFLMNKIYNFEKYGNVNDLLGKSTSESNEIPE